MRRQRPPVRLTKTVLDACTCPPDRKDVWLFDDKLAGFAVRVTRAGSKVFHLQYKAAGRVQRLKLGEYGPLTAEQARRLAEAARGQVAAGADPKGARREAEQEAELARVTAMKAAKADALTLRALGKAWRDLHLAPHRSARYAAEAERTLHLGFPAQLESPARSLSPEQAQEILEGIAKARGPAARRRTHRVAQAAFEWALRSRRLASNPFTAIAPPPKPKARDRALKDAELGAVWRAAQQLGAPFGPFTQMLALTLQRRDEAAHMRWSELSPDLSTWTLPAERTKNGRTHIVHLAPAAKAILRGLDRLEGSDLVFTTNGRTGLSGFARAKVRLDVLARAELAKADPRASLAAWRLHDFRRTGVSTLARLGVLPDVADRILNHQASSTNEGVKAVYQVHTFLPEREKALNQWARHVLAAGAAVKERGEKVVQLRPARR